MLLLFKGHHVVAYTLDGAAVVDGYQTPVQYSRGEAALSGGVTVGGDGVTYYRTRTYTIDGAAEAGGSCRINHIAFGIDGGAKAGGDALSRTFTIGLIDGAAKSGGDGFGRSVVYAANRDGAAEAGGDGVAYYRRRTYTVDGAAEAGGDGVTVSVTKSYLLDGGVLAGGNAIPLTVSRAIDGAAKAGGDGATVTYTQGTPVSSYSPSAPSGAAVVGGDGVGEVLYTIGGSSGSSPSTRHRGPTTQEAILTAFRQRLIDTGVFKDNQVFIAVDPSEATESLPPHDKWCAIVPGQKTFLQGEIYAGGELRDRLTEVVELRIYTRFAADQTGRATEWATNQTLGGYYPARVVAGKFQNHELRGVNGVVLVAEPTRVLSISAPETVRQAVGWKRIRVTVEVSYTEAEP